ncbi:MAG TPA: hypothetical protein VL856_03565 [Acidimicrobiia bacterium]|nr:hypothetical protein [Acidimicrobiia bacterium]
MTKIPIACTLDAGEQVTRRDEWVSMFGRATARAGSRLTFPTSVAVELADLVAREVECCAFFTFTMTVAHGEVVLEVDAPPEANELVAAFVSLA